MAHEWKIGDWCEYKGVRHLCYNVTSDGYGVYLVTSSAYGKHGHCSPASNDSDLKHLPDCTGWNWKPPKPIEPPEGYRLMAEDETIEHGDMFFQNNEWKQTGLRAITVGKSLSEYGRFKITAYARKIEQPPEGYRLLGMEEILKAGDICIEVAFSGKNTDWRDCGTLAVGHSVGFRIDNFGAVCFARKIETPPIVPPEGYRLLDSDEKVLNGDLYLHLGEWKLSYQSGGRLVRDIVGKLNNAPIEAYARKIETAMKPPKGYRWLSDGERTEIGDLFLLDGKTWEPVRNPEVYKSTYYVPHVRKIEPRYRPFANAAEFAPHRDKWISRFEMGVIKPGAWKPIGYSDDGIYPDCSVFKYADAFEQLKFEDGTPFGVIETK